MLNRLAWIMIALFLVTCTGPHHIRLGAPDVAAYGSSGE
jgi:hypothetical protein